MFQHESGLDCYREAMTDMITQRVTASQLFCLTIIYLTSNPLFNDNQLKKLLGLISSLYIVHMPIKNTSKLLEYLKIIFPIRYSKKRWPSVVAHTCVPRT